MCKLARFAIACYHRIGGSLAMAKMISVDDFEKVAQSNLPRHIYDHIRSGADEEQTLRENKKAFERYRLRPRVLRDVSHRDMSTSLLGHTIPFPICVQATAVNKMAHQDGEVAMAKAAASIGTIMVVSSWSSTSLEDIAAAAPEGVRWFQLYVTVDRQITRNIIRRVEAAGYKALVLTIDTPFAGQKYADEKNNFTYPSHIRLCNFEEENVASIDISSSTDNAAGPSKRYKGPILDTVLTWELVDWLCSITTLPVLVKGVLTAETAKEAVEHGMAGIVVSNHGGRQLDGVSSTIDALHEVVQAVKGSGVEVYLDGGVRKGTDVLKALAIGAKAVFLGRPVVWGLAYDGESGARQVLEILRDEFSLAMALMGCARLSDIKSSMIIKGPYTLARL